MAEKSTTVIGWAPIEGIWQSEPDSLTYLGPKVPVERRDSAFQGGIALSGVRFTGGKVKATIILPPNAEAGHILLGYASADSRYITVGIGGYEEAYVIAELAPRAGLRRLKGAGLVDNLKRNHPYRVDVGVEGQRITLKVDGIRVLNHVLSEPLEREQVGLFALGNEPVSFGPVEISAQALSAFVVMQFTSPFNELYEDVIQPVCADLGIEAYRASDIYRPGVILQDIIQGLAESNVIIAEITPANPNVFYELGYSHALNKPVILLAARDTELPFDVGGYRVIFCEDAIRGKSSLETELRRHLSNIFGE